MPDRAPPAAGRGFKCRRARAIVRHALAIPFPPVISADEFARIAVWSRDLPAAEREEARRGIVMRSFPKGALVCHRGETAEHWTGVAEGLVKMSTDSKSGKATTFTGLPTGAWFGEGTVLKNEKRRYDIVALRETRIAMMRRSTFLWLYENSVAFNRFLVGQLNERLGQFIALLEYDRTLDATARLAGCIAWLFNPVLYPGMGSHFAVTQEEIGLLAGLSRQAANRSLQLLEERRLIRVEMGGITVLDLDGLRRYRSRP